MVDKQEAASSQRSAYIIVVILDGLSCEVEHGPGNDALADEVTNLEVRSQHCLRVLVLTQTIRGLSAFNVHNIQCSHLKVQPTIMPKNC